jgi:hypothetical protein
VLPPPAGADVTGLKVGDRVVVNPQAAPSGIIGCGGALGGMREYLVIEDAVVGKSLAVTPDTLPYWRWRPVVRSSSPTRTAGNGSSTHHCSSCRPAAASS